MERKALRLLALLLILGAAVQAEGSPETHDGGAALAAGDCVAFGRYEQDNDSSNGPETIEWTVLDVQGDQALLLSRFPLEQVPYKDSREGTNWMRAGSGSG